MGRSLDRLATSVGGSCRPNLLLSSPPVALVCIATTLSIIYFLSADPTAGAGLTGKAPYTVNHEFKGDKLPLTVVNSSAFRGAASRLHAGTPEEIPVGCDPAFSVVSSPRLAYFYGRCMT